MVISFLLFWVIGSSNSFQECEHTYKNKNGYETTDQHQTAVHSSIVRLKLHTECTGIAITNNQGVISTVATVVVAVFTATLWLSARDQGRLTRDSNDVAKTSADAAAKSAQAAFLQTKSMVAAERAYLIVEPYLTPSGIPEKWRIIGLNTGRTRAHCHSCIAFAFENLPDSDDWISPDMPILMLDNSVRPEVRLIVQIVHIPPNAKHVLGCMTYTDVFEQTYREWFHYGVTLGTWEYVAGDTVWNRTEVVLDAYK